MIHSIKDALPTFDDDSTAVPASSHHNLPAVLVPNGGGGGYRQRTCTSVTPTSLPDGFFSKKGMSPYKVKFKFVPKEGREVGNW
jgi:hypothetical protein